MTDSGKLLQEMNERSREVFRRVVEGYLESGSPVGSRSLTREMNEKVSAATVRNVMQDLEYLGLLAAPHISAGRIPTEVGLRLFVDGILEMGDPAYTLKFGGEIMRLYDPSNHEERPLPPDDAMLQDNLVDRRWVRITGYRAIVAPS